MKEPHASGRVSRRQTIKGIAGLGALSATGLAAPGILRSARAAAPIKIGVILPLTGLWTVFGRADSQGFQLAVDEINAAGGILGRKVEVILTDSQTQPRIVVEQANRLIREDRVDFLAGTFSSAARNAAAPVVTAANKVLLYPTFYEGQEQKYYPGVCNPNIFMFGPTPQQQVWPHMEYMMGKYGKKFFLIGSDYVWPRVTNEVSKEKLKDLDGTVVGEVYIPLGTPQYDTVLRQIRGSGANVILDTMAGGDEVSFRKQFVAAGMNKDFAIWSLAAEEVVTSGLGPQVSAGGYSSFDYFMTLKVPSNQAFIKRLKEKYGKGALMDTVGADMYNAAHMAAMALAKTGKVTTEGLREGLHGLVYKDALQGTVTMRALDNQVIVPSYLMRVREGWTSIDDMFEEIRHVDAVEPGKAECNKLPL
ncbi:MAG: substrate-binding protein [Acetobacteraceae bacterium]